MPEVPTVEIHSLKNASEKWIINESDYDPAVHALWGQSVAVNAILEVAAEPEPEPEHVPMKPSVPDYVLDDDGNIVAVNIIDPDRRTTRKEIPIGEFDPDQHQLWSEHPRFQ